MYLGMLKMGSEMVVLGLPAKENIPTIDIGTMIWKARRKIFGSQIGGIQETQQMLDYSVANNIYPRVEIIPIQKLDEAYRKVLAGDVKFRYVIDMSTLKQSSKTRESFEKAIAINRSPRTGGNTELMTVFTQKKT